MSGLQQATLQALKPTGGDTEGPLTKVQFNPSSLKIQLATQTTPARSPTGPAEQYTGASSTLTLDLHFDSADEGTTATPVNVRDRTAHVARFVLPGVKGDARQAPPNVRFHWGDLKFDGVMTTMTEDLDFFADSGVPLRSKVSIIIQGQDPAFEALATGPGADAAAGASVAGGGGDGIGFGAGAGMSAGFGVSIGGGASFGMPQLSLGGAVGAGISAGGGAGISASFGAATVGVALDGESPADFAVRSGLDPAAWRALAAPGGIELSLKAGTELAFPRGAGTAPGVGSASGAGVPSAGTTLVGIERPGPAPSARAAAATGFALAGAGGVDAALQTALQQHADSASARELEAFGLPPGSTSAPRSSPRMPLRAPAAVAMAPTAPTPPRADERAVSFGAGVPLRPRRALPHAGGAERVVLGRRAPAVVPAPPLAPGHGGGCGCGCAGAS